MFLSEKASLLTKEHFFWDTLYKIDFFCLNLLINPNGASGCSLSAGGAQCTMGERGLLNVTQKYFIT